MEFLEFPGDDLVGEFDFYGSFYDVPEDSFNVLEPECPPDSSPAMEVSNPHPNSVSSSIGEIENLLMKDDDDDDNKEVGLEPSQEFFDNFLAHVLVDSPGCGSGEVVDVSTDKDSNASDDANPEGDKADGQELNNVANDGDDPISKKQRRQLRNRDAAVRSRERKKMYVRDLELKTKYLEGECVRLGRLLQCCYAENQALRFSLQRGNAFGASMAKQESAVLLLDSSPAMEVSNPHPNSVSSSIGEIENLLMKDDDDDDNKEVGLEPSQEFFDNFLAHVLVDSPGCGSGEVVDVSTDKDSNASDDANPEGDKADGQELNNVANDGDDPISKKQRRQLRNRDAAVRSRERKKMYVRDLELKTKYLEGECVRLGRLLQCCYAENQALRFSLQRGNAFGASMAKQESAVLLLESLLLGSLLWFLGIMYPLPLLPLTLEAGLLENVGKKHPESLVPRGPGSKMFGYLVLQSFIKSRRCKASKTKMKLSSFDDLVFVW